MTATADQIVSDVRQLSSLFNNTLFSDVQICKLINDGAAELYDWMVGTFETWFLTSVDFTLGGGVGGNVFAMPMDTLLKDNTLERNPTLNCPQPVPRLGTWSDRNRSFGPGVGDGRRYYPAGSNLMIFPPNLAAGDYRLWYTPKYIPISVRVPVPQFAPPTPASIAAITGPNTVAFTGAAWTSASVGDSLVISNSLNGNNGTFPIATVVSGSTVTVTGTLVAEGGTGVAAQVQPAGTLYTFNTVMAPWVLYPEVHAAIAIRTARQQDSSDLQPKLAQLKQRIETATANRTEEVPQTPLRDSNGWRNYYFGP